MGRKHWHIELTSKAEKSLRKLDMPVLRRIRKYTDEIAELENPRDRGKPLTTNTTGLWRYRIGDYRLICDIQDEQLVIGATGLGQRSSIYDD